MATINYSNARPCGGGGHVLIAISFNGGAAKDVTYTTDAVRQPLSALTDDEKEQFALLCLKIACAGLTRVQALAKINAIGGLTVVVG